MGSEKKKKGYSTFVHRQIRHILVLLPPCLLTDSLNHQHVCIYSCIRFEGDNGQVHWYEHVVDFDRKCILIISFPAELYY